MFYDFITNMVIDIAHGLGEHASVGVDLLQDLVDVDGVRLLPLLVLLLLIALGDSLGGLAGLGSSFSRGLGRHGGYCLVRGKADVMKGKNFVICVSYS